MKISSNDPHLAAIAKREAKRVADMLASDREYQAREITRAAAELEIREGVFVNVADAVVEPTPEWLGKGEVVGKTVRADGEGYHVRVVRTVRRVKITPHVRAYRAGKMDHRQVRACDWYVYSYEMSGLKGNWATWSLNDRIKANVKSHEMFHNMQLEAQDMLRDARLLMPKRFRKFFDMVVIDEVPVTRAKKLAPCTNDPFVALRLCADVIADYMEIGGAIKWEPGKD